jgi:hypothetical protein
VKKTPNVRYIAEYFVFHRTNVCHGGDPVAATVTQQLTYGYGAALELSKLRTIERRPGPLRPSASSVEGAVPRRLPPP